MNDRIIYRPYKSGIWLLPFSVAIAVFCFLLAGLTVPQGDFTWFILFLIGFLALYATKIIYDTVRMVILFDGDGLQIIGTRYGKDSCHFWKDFSYAYCVRNYRGFHFLVLSPKTLSSKEAKRLAGRCVNPQKICMDDAIVISMDNLQNMSHLKELIAGHTMYMDVK